MTLPTLSRIDESTASGALTELFPVAEMYPQLLDYLAQPDGETDKNPQSVQFKHQLGLAMKEVESHRSLLREKALIREEYLRMQGENAKIKAHFDSASSPQESAHPSPSMTTQSIPRPVAEQRGKDWDSIAIDLF